MARFTFNLQTVLEQRENDEHLCQMELAHAQLAQSQLQDELAKVEADINAANESMRNEHLVGKLNVTVITTHRRYLIAMRAQVIGIAQRLAAARLQVEAKQRKLAEAAKNRKAIEFLRDKQKQRWMIEQDKKELAQADDVAMQIAYHNLRAAEAAEAETIGGSAA